MGPLIPLEGLDFFPPTYSWFFMYPNIGKNGLFQPKCCFLIVPTENIT